MNVVERRLCNMTRLEAKPFIVAEMRQRLPRVPYRRIDAGIDYYFELRRARPTLVRGWMAEHGLIGPSNKLRSDAWRANTV